MTVEAVQPRGSPAPQARQPRGVGPRPRPAPEGREPELILALDLGASRIRAGAVDPTGQLRARRERETPVREGPAAVLAAALALLRAVRDGLPAPERDRLVALGIAAPGPLDPRSGVLLEPPNLGPAFRDMPLAGPLGAALGLPAVLERDTHVAALAEHAYGAARGVDDFVYLTVSTGIGGAIVAGGRLFAGPDGLGGELGHLSVEIEGPPCGCGGRGHLEAIASGTGIVRAARAAIERGAAPTLARLSAATGPHGLDARAVAEAEAAGDAAATAIMEHARQAFASALVGIVDVLTPRRIVVGGSLALGQGERLLGPARARVAEEAFRRPAARVSIVPAALGDDVGLAGAIPLLAGDLQVLVDRGPLIVPADPGRPAT